MFGIDDALLLGGVGLLSSAAGARERNSMQADQATQANEFSASQFANRYQTTVKDMSAAGLNPMLAYSQGGGSPPSGQQGQMQDPVGPAVETGYRAFSAARSAEVQKAQIDNIEADSNVKRAQAMLTEAQIGATGASADQSRASIGFMEQQGKKIIAEIENIPKQGAQLDALAQQLLASKKLMDEQGVTQSAQRENLRSLALKAMTEVGLLELDYQAAKDMGNIGREAGQLKPIFDILRSILTSRR